MQSKNIRKNWIDFFTDKSRGHLHLPSASLVPNNPTLLLTNAGMVPFVPYFLGQQKPPSSRAVTVQKCVRVGGKDSDLENIGKTPRHLTFFEMLGNFSFGDYFKEEVVPWAWQLLTEVYGFKSEELIVSIFEGDATVAADEEAFKIWNKKVGVPESRIWRMGRKDNFWGPPGGISGPCGPCSEIYYTNPDGSEPIEIWNLVFMQYEKFEDGSLKPLSKPNIDTGAGLERMASILQGKPNVFETDLLMPIVKAVKVGQADQNNPEVVLATKIIADHLRCSAMLIADGVKPSNLGRGYVLRMLIRRAARFGRLIGLNEPFLQEMLPSVQEVFAGAYPELDQNINNIQREVQNEEEAFNKTIERGLKKFTDLITNTSSKVISGEEAFDLYATYGFPVELTVDLAEEKGFSVDLEAYEKAKEAHSQVSNQGKFAVGFKSVQNSELANLPETIFVGYETEEVANAKILFADDEAGKLVLDKTPFYAESGGQMADHGVIESPDGKTVFAVTDVQKNGKVFVHSGEYKTEGRFAVAETVSAKIDKSRRREIRKHHTATHLLQAALRKVLGSEVQQAGSQVDENKLRFDFSWPKALTKPQIAEVEQTINAWVKSSLPVSTVTMKMEDALKAGALAFFGDKYEDEVRVLQVGDGEKVSVELCGGTHITNTAEIGSAKLVTETAVAAGTRRIEMVVGENLLELLNQKANVLESLAAELKAPESEVQARFKAMQEEIKIGQKKFAELLKQLMELKAEKLLESIQDKNGLKVLVAEVDFENLKDALDFLGNKIRENYVLFLASQAGSKPSYAAKVSQNLIKEKSAKDLVAHFAAFVGGSGGGRPDYAQGGGGDTSKFASALEEIERNC